MGRGTAQRVVEGQAAPTSAHSARYGEGLRTCPSTMLRMVPLPTGFAGREDEVRHRAVLKNRCPPITRTGASPEDQRGDTAAVW